MVENLEKSQIVWKDLMRKGDIEKAEKIYWEEMFPIVKEKFVNDTKMRIENGEIPKYDVLILPIGMECSYYYVMLIAAFKPEKTHFICTEQGERFALPKIVEYARLSPDMYIKDVVEYSGMDTNEIYEKVKRVIEMFKGKKIAVDLTYGKRVMIASAAIACDFFGCDMIYIDEDWMDDIRIGIPGTEKLTRVKNPLHLFGEIEHSYAFELFNRYEYAMAFKLFEALMSRAPDPRGFEIKSLIAQAYRFWDSMNFKNSFHILNDAYNKILQYNFKFGETGQILTNLKVLKFLEVAQSGMKLVDLLKDDRFVMRLVIDVFCNACRRAEQSQFEDAMSRLYRCIEIVSQHRLAKMNIDTASVDYATIESISQKYGEITEGLYGKRKEIASTIPLMDGYIILFSLNDDVWKGKGIKDLKELLECIRLRDYSIIAHGIQLVNRNTFERFRDMTKGILLRLCEMNNENFDELVREHTHLKLNR